MLIVVNGKVEEEKAIIDYLREHYIPKRLTLLISP